jgi:hypothetical protein
MVNLLLSLGNEQVTSCELRKFTIEKQALSGALKN